MDYRVLVDLGLSEKEAKVYLAALELGKSTVLKIAKKAGINRATTNYTITASLMKKGLVSSTTEGKKQYFLAEPPYKLRILLQERFAALQKNEKLLKDVLPSLQSLMPVAKDATTVRYYEGKEGLKSIGAEFGFGHRKEEPVRIAYSEDLLRKVFNAKEIESMRKQRLSKKLKARALYNNQENKTVPSTQAQGILVSTDKYPFPSDLAIYGRDKVRFANMEGKILGIIIENKTIHDTMASLYDLAWLGAKFLTANKKIGRKH